MRESATEGSIGDVPAGIAAPRPRAWRAFRRLGLFGVASCLILFFGGFVIFAGHVSRMSAAEPLGADGIVVLTGGQSRIEAALELLKAGKGKRLLISGVNPLAGARDLRIATGAEEALFRCCIDIDHAALDTIGNAEESAKWAEENAYGSIILVTNNYHMPRSLLEMRRFVHQAVLRPYPVVNTPMAHGEWLTKPDALRVMFTEYSKYVAALARGVLPAAADASDMHVARVSAVEDGE